MRFPSPCECVSWAAASVFVFVAFVTSVGGPHTKGWATCYALREEYRPTWEGSACRNAVTRAQFENVGTCVKADKMRDTWCVFHGLFNVMDSNSLCANGACVPSRLTALLFLVCAVLLALLAGWLRLGERTVQKTSEAYELPATAARQSSSCGAATIQHASEARKRATYAGGEVVISLPD